MTLTTLVSGADALRRETAIAHAIGQLPKTDSVALILEGLASAESPLHQSINNLPWRISRIAPSCPCCIGNLAMRVTLNRMLRPPPQHLFISLAANAHQAQIRAFLLAAPYDRLLDLQSDLITA